MRRPAGSGLRRGLLFGAVFVAAGVAVVAVMSAAGTPVAFEAESGTVAGNASVAAVSGASGGSAVKFAAAATPTPSPGGCAAGEVSSGGVCYPAPPAAAANGKSWKMLFNDEFDGTTLNTANWTPCFDWNYGDCTGTFNNGRERYYPSQVRLSGGTAKLVAEPMNPPVASTGCYQGSCNYKAGLISTARPRADNGSAYLHPFTYGYVEGRMKYPAVSGMFTAFWMLPTDPTFTYASSELDIVEILGGDPNTIFMTYHWGSGGGNRNNSHAVNNGDHNNGACTVKDYSKDWVRFGVDWEPTYVAWYIDGVKCGQVTSSQATIESKPMQLILHMMVDNNWERDWGLTLPNLSTTAQLEVDYVRVYQQQ